eukprot:COSAG01_NODE_52529_length_346_cov_0.631579_2_plen_39_part_01
MSTRAEHALVEGIEDAEVSHRQPGADDIGRGGRCGSSSD